MKRGVALKVGVCHVKQESDQSGYRRLGRNKSLWTNDSKVGGALYSVVRAAEAGSRTPARGVSSVAAAVSTFIV